jgi:CheY-like chemotaxis protein
VAVAENANSASRTVLIVEDAESCATTLEIALLAIPNLTVRITPTARQALAVLEKSGNGICALVTDLHLPSMDGFELIEKVRSSHEKARLPIIVISGDTDPRTPERIYRLGADAYFSKPYSPAQVRQTLEQLLDGHNSSHSP